MILELDCGNSLIKWRVVSDENSAVMQQGAVEAVTELLERLAMTQALALSGCRMVSVRCSEETGRIESVLSESLGIRVAVAQPVRTLGGVTNGYDEYTSLGLDRWLAVVAAYGLSKGACLVVDLGTAATVDLVTAEGKHLGGYITPGLMLLRKQLFGHTRRIRYGHESGEESMTASAAPGRSTAEAVERGCRLMLRSYIEAQMEEASRWLGTDFQVYVTGGDASLLAGLAGINMVPDLVFRGLKIACP